MFDYSIDNKTEITNPEGDSIKDLSERFFTYSAESIKDYNVVRMDELFEMRPDKVSLAMYGHTRMTEFILKFSGVSNPFRLDKEDVLLIPNETQAIGMTEFENMSDFNDNARAVEAQIRNFYKFVNTEYKSDKSSYDALENKQIPSGIIDTTVSENYTVPYISDDGRTAVIIRNGRMYFGEDSGVPSALSRPTTSTAVQDAIKDAVNQSLTALSNSNCLYNGMTLTDYTRATQKNS